MITFLVTDFNFHAIPIAYEESSEELKALQVGPLLSTSSLITSISFAFLSYKKWNYGGAYLGCIYWVILFAQPLRFFEVIFCDLINILAHNFALPSWHEPFSNMYLIQLWIKGVCCNLKIHRVNSLYQYIAWVSPWVPPSGPLVSRRLKRYGFTRSIRVKLHEVLRSSM